MKLTSMLVEISKHADTQLLLRDNIAECLETYSS